MPDFSQFIFVDFENVQDVDLELVRDKPVHVSLLIGHKQTKVPTRLALQFKSFSAQVEPIEVGGSGRNALDLTLAFYLGREIERHPTAQFAIVSRDKDFDPMIAHLQATKINVVRATSFAAVPFFARPKKAPAPRSTVVSASKSAPGSSPPPRKAPVTPPPKSSVTPLPRRIGTAPAPRTRAPAPGRSNAPASASTNVPPRTDAQPTAATPASGTAIPDLARRHNAIFARLSNPTNKNRPATQRALAAHLRTALGNDATDADVAETIRLLEARRVLSVDAQKKVVYAGA